MASLIGYPKFQAFDNSGDPLSGGKVYTYLSGTTTPKDTYTSNTEAVTNANPVILDSRGEANIWLSANFAYTFLIKDSANVTICTVDNIIGVFNPLSGGFGLGGDLQVKDYNITDNNTVAVPYFDFTTTVSAVNYFGVTNATAGNNPKFSAIGASTNIGVTLQAKGTGNALTVTGSGGSTTALTVTNVASAVNYVDITNAATGTGPTIAAVGANTNISLTLAQKGAAGMVFGAASCTGYTFTTGNLTLTSGSITVTSGNVTLTSGNLVLSSGTITSSGAITASSGNLTASSGTLSVSSPVTTPNGGTGLASTTAYAVLCGGTTSTAALQSIASVGTAGQVLTSNGASALPTMQNMIAGEPQLRLTLTTATPVTTSDVTAATTLYYSPYTGKGIALYDGSSAWTNYITAEISIAIPATTSTMYDVFCYANAGTPTLELLAWTNDTTRATALTTQDGIYVKTGATTRRYVGSVRTTGVSGQTEDSIAKRYVWNMYHRVHRAMRVIESTASWTYTTATWRQARATATNQIDWIRGLDEDTVNIVLVAAVSSTGANTMASGIGLDSTTTVLSSSLQGFAGGLANAIVCNTAAYNGLPGIGRRTGVWLEYSTAAGGTTTWYGTFGSSSGTYCGIVGSILG